MTYNPYRFGRPAAPRVPAAPRPPADYVHAIDAHVRKLAEYGIVPTSYIPSAPPKPKRGDVVSLKVTAYVRTVNTDGTYTLAETVGPWADPLTLDRVHASRLTVEKAAPDEPKVGDVISGKLLKATPWRRGTIVRYEGLGKTIRWALLGTGDWVDLDNGRHRDFAAFGDQSTYTVDAAPGKASK